MPPKLRRFTQIPIFIVENHNEILEFILRCLGAHYLPFAGNKIIHFDSHPDMTIPKYMPAEFVRNKEKLLDAISIENWLMPTVYAGHFDRVVWVKPQWAHQIDDGRWPLVVGDDSAFIRCDSTLEYFLGEGTYCPQYQLNNSKSIDLCVMTLQTAANGHSDSDNNDATTTSAHAVHDNAQAMAFDSMCGDDNDDDNYVLDIDLDFFSTHNPFLEFIANGNQDNHIYVALKKLFKGKFFEQKFNANSDTDLVMAFVKQRMRHLDDLEQIFVQLNDGKSIDAISPPSEQLKSIWHEIVALIEMIRVQNVDKATINWMCYYDAGCTFDSSGLPHHESTTKEIDQHVNAFKHFLEKLQRPPTIITMSRSSTDDYCPAHQVEYIQTNVLKALTDVYGERLAKPILHYKDEEWHV